MPSAVRAPSSSIFLLLLLLLLHSCCYCHPASTTFLGQQTDDPEAGESVETQPSPSQHSSAQPRSATSRGRGGETLAHTANAATRTHTQSHRQTLLLSLSPSLTLVLGSAQLLYSLAADSLAHSLASRLPVALPCCALPACLRMVQPVPGGLLSRPV